MKIDNEFMKKLLIGGMIVLFMLIAASYAFEKDNVTLFVNGDEVKRDVITIGSIASIADKYKFDPGEKMEISMDVTNDRNQDYDFKVKVWEEKTLGSQEIVAFESDPVTIEESKSFTFSTEYTVPLEPGTYFISTISYYAPVGHMNFATYDDGTYFSIVVLDNPPVTPEPTEEATEEATGTPTVNDTDIPPSSVTGEDDYLFGIIDLEDESTQIGIALIIMILIPVIGFFVIRYKNKR